MYSNDEDKAEGYNMYMHVSTFKQKPSEVNYTWYFIIIVMTIVQRTLC